MRPFTHIAIGEQTLHREKRDVTAFQKLKKLTVKLNCCDCGSEILQTEARCLSQKMNIDSRQCKKCWEKSKKEFMDAQVALALRKANLKNR